MCLSDARDREGILDFNSNILIYLPFISKVLLHLFKTVFIGN